MISLQLLGLYKRLLTDVASLVLVGPARHVSAVSEVGCGDISGKTKGEAGI